MSVAIYVEGGGDSKQLKADCRRGFRKFFEKAGLENRMPRIHACGSRNKAFDRFSTAFDRLPSDGNTTLLLVDSEGPVAPRATPWSHLKKRDRWTLPPGASNDHVHLMVQFMESWFLADRECLAEYFGSGFGKASLPANPNVEEVPKGAVMSGLKRATKSCKSGPYSKGGHSFRILAEIDPAKVKAASPYAKRLIDTVAARSAAK